MKVKVSIIIPVFNIAPYIDKCLRSVLRQTLEEIEVIIVDDGSTDNIKSKIKAYETRDCRVKLIQKENGGVTSARLAGVRQASGEYIGFIDGDDIIEPNMYERLLNNAVKYNAEISHCGYQMVFPNRIDYYYNTGIILQQDTITALKDLISGEFIEPALVNKLFHKRLFHNLINNKLMDLSIKYNEDLLMNYFLFRECQNAVYEDWCPYHYIIRPNSATSAAINVQKLTDPIKVLKRLETETLGNKELQHIVLRRLTYQLVVVSSENMERKKDLLAVQQKCRKELNKRLHEIMRCPACNQKNKLAALWVSIWPWSYGIVHKIYAHITGIDKKYSVE